MSKISEELKKLKESYDKSSRLELIKEFVVDTYYKNLVYPLTAFKENLIRAFQYAKFGYSTRDYDSAYFYQEMAFKLKRIQKCIVGGYAVHEDKDLANLQEAIDILNRLFAEDYDAKYEPAHEEKYGEIKITFEPNFEITHSKVTMPEQKAEEWQERMKIYENSEADRQADMDRLAVILKESARTWWY